MSNYEIRLDRRGAMATRIRTDGLTEKEWSDLGKETSAIVARLNAARAETPYRDLPSREALSQRGRVLESVRKKKGKFDDVVVLGIGGSALGLTALKTALRPPFWNLLGVRQRGKHPRLWVMDNVDPAEFAAMLEWIDPKRTLFNVISKSGETAETMSQFLVALDLLEDCVGKKWRGHVVVTTDARKGTLRPLAEAEGLESFAVPDGVGGRFSVLSPVGLFGAAMIGIDIEGLLAGAAEMDKRCAAAAELEANPAAEGAAVQIGLYRKGKVMSVMMPYAAALKDVADWYRQLWAESLGKRRADGTAVGPTPIKALGATDQHSQVQLYREGPNDKVVTILGVEEFGAEVPLPEAPEHLEGLEYLSGRTMKELLKAEERATAWALGLSKRPTVRIMLEKVSPPTVGALLQMLMVQTSIAGEMLGINTYNQPGVEAGKQAAMALMGKTGAIANPTSKGLPAEATSYETLRRQIEKDTA